MCVCLRSACGIDWCTKTALYLLVWGETRSCFVGKIFSVVPCDVLRLLNSHDEQMALLVTEVTTRWACHTILRRDCNWLGRGAESSLTTWDPVEGLSKGSWWEDNKSLYRCCRTVPISWLEQCPTSHLDLRLPSFKLWEKIHGTIFPPILLYILCKCLNFCWFKQFLRTSVD